MQPTKEINERRLTVYMATTAERRAVESAAKADGRTVSSWVAKVVREAMAKARR